MRYQLQGEEWIPEYEVKKYFKVSNEQLTEAVENEKIRVETLINPHSDKAFKVFPISDLEELFGTIELKPEQWL